MRKQADYRILLADNNDAFLKTTAEALGKSGYHLRLAHNPEEARSLLQTERIHMAILDLRLERDSDERDKSGLQLALEVARPIPKVILTNFPVYSDVVRAMKRDVDQLQAAVEFLDKRETTLEELKVAIAEVLQQYVHINWDLVIEWQSSNKFLELTHRLDSDLPQPQVLSHVAEVEDLFRKLFYRYAQITVGKSLAQNNGRIILPVFAFDDAGVEARFIVSFGRRTAVLAENQRYEKMVPQRFGIKNIGKLHSVETVHYGATAYTFMGSDLEATTTLKSLFQARAMPELLAAVSNLYQENLGGWYATGRKRNPDVDLRAFYYQWLGLAEEACSFSQLAPRLEALAQKTLSNRLVQIDPQPFQITFRFNQTSQSWTFPNPVRVFNQQMLLQSNQIEWGVTHGRVTDETVLVDKVGKAWVIDFAQVSRAPLLIDFASLETAVKYNLLDSSDVEERFRLEQKLLQTTHLSDEINLDNLSHDSIHAVWVIERIRHLAAELAGCDLRAYREALLVCALARLTAYEPDRFYTRRVLCQYAHALLEAAMLVECLTDSDSQPVPEEGQRGLWLDKVNKVIYVKGRLVELTSQEFDILSYLYENAGQLCERKDIVEKGLGELFDPYDPEQSRLNSAISRLRRKLEPDSQNPRYLLTVHGRGYKLVLIR